MSRILFENALLVNEGESFEGWLLTEGPLIGSLGRGVAPDDVVALADERIDASGKMLLPGVIDTHVHFRDPGLTEKADMATESRAAVAGGVTSFLDMPNTVPQTTSIEALEAKKARAAEVSEANYGFFIGATNNNIDTLRKVDFTKVPGVKLFLGSSTGNMLVDAESTLHKLFEEIDAVIAVHAEDEAVIAAARERLKAEWPDGIPVELHPDVRPREACVAATRRAISLAEETGARVHVCHVSTADELRLIADAKRRGVKVTAETCPQYLLWDRNDFLTLGARVKCNPSIKEASDRIALVRALAEGGVIDTIATDHAPHLLSQKQGDALKAASGMPMIQFSLPAMLDLAATDPEAEDLVTPGRIVELMCHAPARLFGIERRGFLRPGYYADLVLVEPVGLSGGKISDTDVVSRCGWTPLAGRHLSYRVDSTWVNGRKGGGSAMALEFEK
ncbi:MAG: amidohydrolase family protein [Duncaniella sp.]|nr:amidohydrolase family protein [Duncaniella sp.]